MDIEKLFKAINKRMLLDVEEISSEIQHRGAKGKVRENDIISEYFKKYIPSNIGITNGEIISVDGTTSPETDIILHDKNSTPFLRKETYQVLPIECVHGIVEVKSKLDKNQLQDSFDKINFIKKMPKKAFEAQKGPIIKHTTIYGKQWPYFPAVGIVVAFDSIDLKTLLGHYLEMNLKEEPEFRIDSVWVLNQGMLINYNPKSNMIELSPTPFTITRAVKSDNPLLMLTTQLQSILMSAWMPNFMIKEYLIKAKYGDFYD